MSHTLKNWLLIISVAFTGSSTLAAQDAQDSEAPKFEEAPVLLEKDDADEFGHLAMQRVLQSKQVVNMGTQYELMYETAKRIERTSGRADIDWSFTLLENELLQAWSLPGGKVAVNTGLMRNLGDKQEVAALLAHQMAHVLLGHDLFVLNQNGVQNNVLSQKVSFTGNQWEELAEKTGALLAKDMHVGAYSRMMESEADDLAGVLLIKAGFDPAAQIGLWQFMKYEKQLNPEYVLSHPSVDFRIEQMQGSLPCYYQVYKEVWGQLPAGLKSAGGNGNVQCPPIVTGVMGQIRGNSNEDTQEYADSSSDVDAYEDGYEDGYSNGRKSRRMAYNWSGFHGYHSIYYDHAFYNNYFGYDPYYMSWNYGFSNYMSYRIILGGHHYYRWSPVWYGWNYYQPYRPHYRIAKKNRKHYRRHARFERKANYKSRKRFTRRGDAVTYDRVALRKSGGRGVVDGRRVVRKQRLNEVGGATSRVREADRPRGVKRDGKVATRDYTARKHVRGGAKQQARDNVTVQRKQRMANGKLAPAVRAKNSAKYYGSDSAVPKANRTPARKRNVQPSGKQRKRAIENTRERVGITKSVRQQGRDAVTERPKARRAQSKTQTKTPLAQPRQNKYTVPKTKAYKTTKKNVHKAAKKKAYKAQKTTTSKSTTAKTRKNPRKFDRSRDN